MRVDRLTSADRILVNASALWPQEIGAIAMLDGTDGVDLERVRAAVAGRLHLVPRLRQAVHDPGPGLGGPLWADDPRFDLARHIGVRPLEPPGGEDALIRAASALWLEPMDLQHPLWRMWLLPGVSPERVGLFIRIHHAVADGRAAMVILDALLDRRPVVDVQPPEPWRPRRVPGTARLLADRLGRVMGGMAAAARPVLHPLGAFRRAREALPAVRELVGEPPASLTSLNRLVGPGRRFAVVRADLHRLRRAARLQGATVNDAILGITAAGLEALLEGRGEPTRGVVVRAYVPVSMRRRLRGGEQGTAIAQMVVPVAVRARNPGDRLRRIAVETRRRKGRARTSVGTLFSIGFVSRYLLKLVSRQRVNVSTTFLPGPRRPRYLAGARVAELFPTMNLIGAVGLGVCATSYAGALAIGVTADRDGYPDLDVFVDRLRAELTALEALGAPGERAGRAAAVA